jgi:hypothetical protein
MRPTLVFIKAHYIDGSLVHRVGDECPPNTFSTEVINQALDERHLVECPERRSLFRLLHRFSGSKEQEKLSEQERKTQCI